MVVLKEGPHFPKTKLVNILYGRIYTLVGRGGCKCQSTQLWKLRVVSSGHVHTTMHSLLPQWPAHAQILPVTLIHGGVWRGTLSVSGALILQAIEGAAVTKGVGGGNARLRKLVRKKDYIVFWTLSG